MDWKPVPSYPEIEASAAGGVKWKESGETIKTGESKGYVHCFVSSDPIVTRRAHRLVAEAFHGPCPEGLEVDHVNGVKTDNRASNLEYVTHEENMRRARERGLIGPSLRGEDVNTAILTEEDVTELLNRFVREEYTVDELALVYGVGRHAIFTILDGKNWKHVKRPRGLEKAKKRKGHYGKRPSHDLAEEVRTAKANGSTYDEIERRFGVGRATAHRMIKRQGRYAHA